jgi:hypothetical protein
MAVRTTHEIAIPANTKYAVMPKSWYAKPTKNPMTWCSGRAGEGGVDREREAANNTLAVRRASWPKRDIARLTHPENNYDDLVDVLREFLALEVDHGLTSVR